MTSGDTHPWGGASGDAAVIGRKLLAGAEPVCCACYRVLEPTHPNGAVLLRCCDYEYRAVHG